MAIEWQTYAILTPTKPTFNKKGEPVEWKVQRNEAGQWRCHCPAYIFSGKGGAVRSCKHIRRCQLEILNEQTGTQPVTQPVAKPTPQHPQWASATTITRAMLDQARVNVTPPQLHQMIEVLAAKLAVFVPVPKAVVKVSQTVEIGVRRIVFED